MKTLLTFLSISLFSIGLALGDEAEAPAKPKYGPAGAPRATVLRDSHEYLNSSDHAAPDYWQLSAFYVPQKNDHSCSSASIAMVLNAALAKQPRTADDQNIRQEVSLEEIKSDSEKIKTDEEALNAPFAGLVQKVQYGTWQALISDSGFKVEGEKEAQHGTTLDLFSELVGESFKAYKAPLKAVKTVHVSDTSPETRASVIADLIANEASGDNFILANFSQGAFTDDTYAGHISPVGAYDAENERVLILDTDRKWYEPYWVSVDDFIKGMATVDDVSGKNRGYLFIEIGQ